MFMHMHLAIFTIYGLDNRQLFLKITRGGSSKVFLGGVLGEQPSVSLSLFWEIIQINWLLDDLSTEGASSIGGPGVCPPENFEN
jgi:hypothetical protein